MEDSINNYKQNLIAPHKETNVVSMKSKEGCSDKKMSKTDKSYCNNEYRDSSFSTNKNKSYHNKTLGKGSDSSLVSLKRSVNNTQNKKEVTTSIDNTINLLVNEMKKKLKYNTTESGLHKEHLGKKKKRRSGESLFINEEVSFLNDKHSFISGKYSIHTMETNKVLELPLCKKRKMSKPNASEGKVYKESNNSKKYEISNPNSLEHCEKYTSTSKKKMKKISTVNVNHNIKFPPYSTKSDLKPSITNYDKSEESGTDNISSSVNNVSTKEHGKLTINKALIPSVNKIKQKNHNKPKHSNNNKIKTNLSQKIKIKKYCTSDISFIEQFLIQSALKNYNRSAIIKSTSQSEKGEHFSEPSNAVQRKRYIELMKKYKKHKKKKKLAKEIENIQSRLLLKALEGNKHNDMLTVSIQLSKQAKQIELEKNYVDPKQKPLINLKQQQEHCISKKDIPDLEALQKKLLLAVAKDFNNSTIAKKHTQNRKNKLKKEKKAFN